uniref:39S ribosomal protein L12, mitochondrial n=1 Tax=Rhabditophanes sp. KR3021 TaxID=114890 RepID=A0AC35TPB1_9BILA
MQKVLQQIPFGRQFNYLVRSFSSVVGDAKPAAAPSDERVLSTKVKSLVDQIAELSILEASDLNYGLRKKLNLPEVSAFGGGAMMMAAPVASAAEAVEDASDAIPKKMSFTVRLTKFEDDKKIKLIKQIRDIIPGLNLVQAKKFVETAPCDVKTDLGQIEAEQLKTLLESTGATAEIV